MNIVSTLIRRAITTKIMLLLLGQIYKIESKLASLKDQQFTLLNKQIKLSLVEILGFKQTAGEDGPPLTDMDLQNWVRSTFVAKEFLEQRLLGINAHTIDMIRQEIDRSGMLLMRDISERLKQDILLAIDAKQNERSAVIKAQGFRGFLVLKLNSLVYVTGLEHISKSLSPNGRIESAPRNFTVWGLEHEKDQDPVLFGAYEYVDSDASLQYFPLRNMHIKRPYEIVELRIESNHGHPTYTCLYRFRVHGKPPAA